MKTVKARNIVCNKELLVKIIDNNYSDTQIEAEILEGSFKGKYVIVAKNDLIINNNKVKLELTKFENEDSFTGEMDRALTVTVSTDSEELLDVICDTFEIKLEDEGMSYTFARCRNEDDNNIMVEDSMYIDFEYGEMAQLKKTIKQIWKQIKQGL